MSVRAIAVIIAIISSVQVASAQLQAVRSSKETKDCKPLKTFRELLMGPLQDASLLEKFGEVGDKHHCATEMSGHFIFCVEMPFECKEEVPDRRFEWETCLVYDKKTCCHKWVKFKKIIDFMREETRIEMRPQKFCVKLSVPIDTLCSATECDCPELPGANLNSLSKKRLDDLQSRIATLVASRKNASSGSKKTKPLTSGVSTPTELVSLPARLTRQTAKPANARSQKVSLQVRRQQTSGQEGSLLFLANRGDQSVDVERITFKPKEIIAASAEAHSKSWSRARSANAKTILVDSSHNLGRSGKHGTYEFVPENPMTISPRANDMGISIAINNKKHFGWGLVGDLVLTTSNGSQLRVPDFRVLFVSAPERR